MRIGKFQSEVMIMSNTDTVLKHTVCLHCGKPYDVPDSNDWFFCSKTCRRVYIKIVDKKIKEADAEADKHADGKRKKKRK